MNNNVINFINFIRGCEPRREMDLLQPVKDEMALAVKHGLPVTWLFQYDALRKEEFVNFVKENMPVTHECGMWLEIVQENVEKAGLPWRGRFPWDWHADCGFSIGYTQSERKLLADVMMKEFHRHFGHYPSSVGCWFVDAFMLTYLHETYGVSGACICRDQTGNDGYTLWGGYWANGYYPTRKNIYMPASSPEQQLDVPVFRMLGSDPLEQYDRCLLPGWDSVCTMEPFYPDFGGNPQWVDWFLKENFNSPNFAMSYIQIGQENSFGSPSIVPGLTMQCEKVAALRDAGKITVETLGETAARFRREHRSTPVSANITLQDMPGKNRQGIWYLSKFQRLNIVRQEDGSLELRDWHIFHEDLPETHLEKVCTTCNCSYLTPPVVDSLNWAPTRFVLSGTPAGLTELRDAGNEVLTGSYGEVRFRCEPDGWEISNISAISYRFPENFSFTVDGNRLCCRFESAAYGVEVQTGSIEQDGKNIRFIPESGTLKFKVFTNR